MSEPMNNGELLLPVCIPESEITEILSALDLYRVLKKEGKSYIAFDAVIDALEFIDNPQDSPCLEFNDAGKFDCETFDTFTDAMDFYPNDPFNPSPDAPDLYLEWIRWADIPIIGEENQPEWLSLLTDNLDVNLFGYEANDCLLVPNLITSSNPIERLENLLDSFTNFPLPTVTIVTEGAGTVGVEFLNVPLGGRAVVLRDIDITLQEVYEIITDTISPGNEGILGSISIVELNRDILSVPPETASTQVQEYEFTEDDTNTIRIIFLPAFNDELPFLFPFGGIRSFRACGNISVKSISTGDTISRTTFRKGFIMGTKEEICEGVICAIEKISQRILFATDADNIRAGIKIDKDTGQISLETIGGSTGVEVPEGATSEEILYGQAVAVATGFRDMVGEIVAWDSNAIPVGTIVNRIRQFYRFLPFDTVDNLLDALTSSLADATDVTTPAVNVTQLANIIYCNGASKPSLYRYALEVEDSGGTDAVDIAAFYRDLIDEIEQEQIDLWYENGSAQPNTGYTAAPCYRLPVQEFIYTASDFASIKKINAYIFIFQQANRQYRIESSGKFIGVDGSEFDGFYYKAPDGTITDKRGDIYFRRTDLSAFSRDMTLPIYNPNAKYSATVVNDSTTAYIGGWEIAEEVTTTIVQQSPTGQINVKIYDMGEA